MKEYPTCLLSQYYKLLTKKIPEVNIIILEVKN